MPLQNRANVRRTIEAGELTQISAWYEEERNVVWMMLHAQPHPCVAQHIRAGDREPLMAYARACVDAVCQTMTGFGVGVISIASIEGKVPGRFEHTLAQEYVVAQDGVKKIAAPSLPVSGNLYKLITLNNIATFLVGKNNFRKSLNGRLAKCFPRYFDLSPFSTYLSLSPLGRVLSFIALCLCVHIQRFSKDSALNFLLQRLRRVSVRQFSLVVLAGCIASPRSYAQVIGNMAPPAEQVQEGLRRQEQRNLEQQQHLQPKADILRADTVKAASFDLPVETPCFTINKITVGDDDERRFAALADVARPFLNHCIGVQGLHKVAAVLNARLVEQGYVTTSVSFPAQNLSLGTLAFKLHTGRVAGIELVQAGAGERLRDTGWGNWKNAFPLEVGDVLNIRALEQGVEQMTRLRSQEVTTRIEPGQEADSSIVFIERNLATFAERLYGSVTLDNSGSETLGRPQLSGNVTLDNLAGVNDVFTVSGNINAHRPTREHRSYSLAVSYNIPWDYHTFNLSQNSNHFAQFVQGTTARFLSSGSSSTSEAKWSYLAWRTGSTKAGVYGTVSMRRARSYLDDVELVVQRRRTTTLELGATLKQFAGQGVVDLALGYRRGMGWGGAQEDFTDAETGGPTLRPRVLSLNGGFSHPFKLFGQAFKYSGSVRAQATRDTTLSIDQISIGGYGSVRGFDGDSVLLAESGLVLRNEVLHALPAWAGVSSNAFVALDAGVMRGASADKLVGKSLAGIAVGTRGRWKNLMFEVSIATPVHKPSKFRTCSVNPYVSVTYAP